MSKVIAYPHATGLCVRAVNFSYKLPAETEDEFLNRVATVHLGLAEGSYKLVDPADFPGTAEHRGAWELHPTQKKVVVNADKAAAIDAARAAAEAAKAGGE